MKIIVLLLLALAVATCHESIDAYLGETAFGPQFKMTTSYWDQWFVYIDADISGPLQANQTYEVICAHTNPDFQVSQGAKAFVFQIKCKEPSEGCDAPSSENFISSSISPSEGGYIWSQGGNNLNDHWGAGAYWVKGVSATYNIFSEEDFTISNFPPTNATTHLKCMSQKSSLGEQGITDFSNSVYLESDQFLEHNVIFSPNSSSVEELSK